MLTLDSKACSGCQLCMAHCSLARTRAVGDAGALLRIERAEKQSAFFVRHCAACRERSCVEACPSEALSVDPELGVLRLDARRCGGCGACAASCAHRLLRLADDLPQTCDLCDGSPLCALVCPSGALRWTDTPLSAPGRAP